LPLSFSEGYALKKGSFLKSVNRCVKEEKKAVVGCFLNAIFRREIL